MLVLMLLDDTLAWYYLTQMVIRFKGVYKAVLKAETFCPVIL